MKKELSWGWVRALLRKNYNWKRSLFFGVCVLLIGALYSYKLGSLTNHSFSVSETMQHAQSVSIKNIFENPINVVHKTVTYVASQIFDGPIAARIACALFSVGAVVLLFGLLRKWHSTRTSLFASSIFATSALMLHIGRWGGGTIAAVTIVLLLMHFAACVKYQNSPGKIGLFGAAALLAISLYTPGVIWFVVLFGALGYKEAHSYLSKYKASIKIQAAVFGLLLLGPLVKLFVTAPKQALQGVIGLSYHDGFFANVLENIYNVPRYFVFGGYENAQVWLNGIAVLDILMIVLVLLGLYYYVKNRKNLTRFWPLCLFGILCFVLTVVGSFTFAPLLFVSLTLIMAGGIHELTSRWFTVFPKNVLAQNFALALLSGVIAVSVLYNMRQYFVAWPEAPATKDAYSSVQTLR